MHIEVGPAGRPGSANAIYDEPLKNVDLAVDLEGDLTLTLDAAGVNCPKSRYRYKIRLIRKEAMDLVRTVSRN